MNASYGHEQNSKVSKNCSIFDHIICAWDHEVNEKQIGIKANISKRCIAKTYNAQHAWYVIRWCDGKGGS